MIWVVKNKICINVFIYDEEVELLKELIDNILCEKFYLIFVINMCF